MTPALLVASLLTAAPLMHERAMLPVVLVPLARPVSAEQVKEALSLKGCEVQVESGARSGYPGLSDESLQYTGFMLQPAELESVKKAKQAVLATVVWPRSDRKKLREVYEAIAALAASTGSVIEDVNAASVFTVEGWRARRIERGWKGDSPEGAFHFQVHMVPEDNGLFMLDTGGLARFGITDLTVLDVNRAVMDAAGDLVNAVAQTLIDGGKVDAQGRLTVKLKDDAKTYPNAKKVLVVGFAAPNEALGGRPEALELTFPELRCRGRGECLEAALDQLFGSQDKAQVVKHDAAVMAAKRRALDALKPYEAKVKAGLPPQEALLVKARFPFGENSNEWMWVDVHAWNGTVLKGRLDSSPEYVDLKAGAAVEVKLADVMDYIYRFKDGTFYGNEVGRVIKPELFEDAGQGRWRYRE